MRDHGRFDNVLLFVKMLIVDYPSDFLIYGAPNAPTRIPNRIKIPPIKTIVGFIPQRLKKRTNEKVYL